MKTSPRSIGRVSQRKPRVRQPRASGARADRLTPHGSDTPHDRHAWAVLAYTVADDKGTGDSLDAAAKDELKALFDAADFGRVRVAAQVDFKHTLGVFRASLTHDEVARTTRRVVRANPQKYPLWREISRKLRADSRLALQTMSESNAAASDVLRNFLRYGRTVCPAERHVISFYGHAQGPMGLFFDADAQTQAKNTLRLNDLAESIAQADQRASVVIFRDCFMSALETACQLQYVAEFIVASQALMPIAGVWPWSYFVDSLMPTASSLDQARSIAKGLSRFLDVAENRGPYSTVPVTVLDVDGVESLYEPFAALVHELEQARHAPKRCAACADALERSRIGRASDHERPGDPALVDLVNLCERLALLAPDPVAPRAAAVAEVIRTNLVRWHHSSSRRCRGLSVYYKPTMPRDFKDSNIQWEDGPDADEDAKYYRRLALCTRTGWDRIALNPLPRRPRRAH